MGLYSDNTLLVRQLWFPWFVLLVLQIFNLLLSLILLPSLAVFCDGSSHIPPPLFPLSASLSISLSLSASLSISLSLSASLSLCLYFYFSPYLSLSFFLSLSLSQCITSPLCIHLPIYLTSGLPDEAVELSELRLLSLKNNRITSLQGAFFQSWVKVIMELSLFISCFLSSD